MSDATAEVNATDEMSVADEASDTGRTRPSTREPNADRVRRYLDYALLAGLALLALVAAMQFYVNASAAVSRWVTSEYRSLFQALFNLVVLLVVGAVISRRVHRLSVEG